jgi:bifunctional DNA-binding transcriptional regulator/antitoxin component of YhaV-PrlF toxin-antitoxin module
MTTEVKRRRRRTRLSSKHQVTIPVDAVREAGLEVGEEFSVVVEPDGNLRLVRERDPVAEFAGSIDYPEGYLDALRDEWDRDAPPVDLR